MGFIRQFGLLLWKNWLIQKRKVALTVVELVLPCVLLILLIMIRKRIITEEFPDGVQWNEFSADRLPRDLAPMGLGAFLSPNVTIPWAISYTPDNPVTKRIVNRAVMKLRLPPRSKKINYFYH